MDPGISPSFAPTVDPYVAFARRVCEGGIIGDPWLDGAPRFQTKPLLISEEQKGALYRAAEDVARVYHAMCLILEDEPRLLGDVLGLSELQKAMWGASAPFWHGIARADVFFTDDGIAIAELNCDTPTGEAEACVLGALLSPSHSTATDPNAGLATRFQEMVRLVASRGRLPEAGPVTNVGLVYPTELAEDLAVVRLYTKWLEEAGLSVVLGSPFNLTFKAGRTWLFDQPIDLLVRHYKTDLWGERESVWIDEPCIDASPLAEPLAAVFAGIEAGTLSVVNPFGAVVPQNKRAMAFMWEQIHRFTPRDQKTIETYIPVSRRLEIMHPAQLLAEREEWVIKSDYGAEGDEVIVGRYVDDVTWRQCLERARPGRWIAQRFFRAEADASSASVNYGVFLVAGRAAGIYARVQRGPTDGRALSAPILVVGAC